jgi:hypothetical protein
MRFSKVWTTAALLTTATFSGTGAPAQTAAGLPHAAGTVKSTSSTGLTLTTAAGQDVTVTVPAGAKVLVVPPGSTTLKSATDGTLTDVAPGDRALVTGQAGDTATTLTASRVILMKANAIAQVHAAEDAAWTEGGGGIVKSVDPATGNIVVANGLKTFIVDTKPATIVRRYSGDSVRFADAQPGTLQQIHPGDQLRVRGAKSPDGSTIQADELVTGTFHNYSGLVTSVNSAAGTVALKDLATKKTVTVAVTPNSDLRRLPPFVAQRVAAQMRGGAAKAGGSEARPEAGERGGGAAGGEDSDTHRAGRAGMDLSQMLARLPTETLSNIKEGDAVMIVATAPSSDSEKSTAVTLLVGVDAILTAPSGQSMTLTPWSVGSGEPADAGGGGGEGGGGGGPH